MTAKRALIVDDSKSARVVLSRMLQKYGLDVDTAESAEAAIDYLVHQSPDVIFMDHLMPGMDGFQAVQAIKNNPRTATIPIMMYTSQEGELYVGQARALGAVGVLPKLVKPVDVSKVLYQLHLLPDRRDPGQYAFVPVTLPDAIKAPPLALSAAGLVPADWPQQLETALRNHDAELRRFVLASLDSHSDRIVGDFRHIIQELPVPEAPSVPERKGPYWWLAAVAAALIPGIVLAIFYSRMLETNQSLGSQIRRLETANAALTKTNAELESNLERQMRLEAEAAMAAAAGTEVIAPDGGQVELVPYGEIPLAGARLEALRGMIAELRGRSFRGVIEVKPFTGRFCLSGSQQEGYALAAADLPATRCDLIGNPFTDSLGPAQQQSLAFANLAGSLRRSADATIKIEVAAGEADPVAAYPVSAANVTAGAWNEIAARNNRVELRAVPAQ